MSPRCSRHASVSHRDGDAVFARFVSAKTTSAIDVRSTLVAYALVQLSLDGSVSEISPGFALAVRDRGVVGVDAVITSDEGRFGLIVESSGSDLHRPSLSRELARRGLRLLARDEGDVLRDPFAANADLVWKSRDAAFSASDQIRVLNHLAEYGPSPIVDLEHAVDRGDGWAALMAMCCRGIIDLELRHRSLGPYTRASCRGAG